MPKTTRRRFLKGAALTSGALVASPAIAQSNPEIKWRMPLFVPRPFVSYSGRVVFYLGWNTFGFFGIKLNFRSAPK